MRRFLILVMLLFVGVIPMISNASETFIKIYYEDKAQFELVDMESQRIMIDVYNPNRLTTPPSKDDILLTTHSHWDHLNTVFFNAFPGRILSKPGILTKGKILIRGIMSSHYSIPEYPIPQEHRNIVYIIDYNGLRIVHFGDNQQLALTKEQLQIVGRVDIAIVSLTYDPMGIIDPAGFGFLTQIKPKLIIPAHFNENAGNHGLKLWKGYRTEERFINVGPEELKGETKLLLMGENAHLFTWSAWPPCD